MTGFVRIGGVPHHVTVEGAGPVCVLSAGLAMCWFDWEPVVPLLAPHRTVVRFDRPGHGLSGPATAAPTAAGEAHRIAAVLDALGMGTERVTAVGHSLAGFHAEAFARLYPARTAGLVLVDSSVEERARPPLLPALHTATARSLGTALAAVGAPAALGPLARRMMVRLSRAGHAPDPAPTALVRRCYRTRRVLDGALLENAHYMSVAAELLSLRPRHPLPPHLPVRVLATPEPPWSTRQRALATTLNAHFTPVPATGHLMMLDRPDTIAGAVLHP
ncbi:alpha/beta fold hydrolase [Streptomyces sp. TRM49041]|uniref:alpha/beta fold hydrolase n=1 Tax=Streptomyces sp. TRM49041 TaxID=2603216 RepID=UPI0011EED264|nr:alpha/beta hydrolase [Streptomyces sp. TRM49041]